MYYVNDGSLSNWGKDGSSVVRVHGSAIILLDSKGFRMELPYQKSSKKSKVVIQCPYADDFHNTLNKHTDELSMMLGNPRELCIRFSDN